MVGIQVHRQGSKSLKRWAARFNQAPRQNFTYITVAQLIKQYPEYQPQRTLLEKIAALPDRLCTNCEQFNVWKFVMDKIPDNEMCFTCITGETDASEDYELATNP